MLYTLGQRFTNVYPKYITKHNLSNLYLLHDNIVIPVNKPILIYIFKKPK